MEYHRLTAAHISAYGRYLRAEERSSGTVEKYLRDVRAFMGWLDGRAVTKDRTVEWKAHLLGQDYAPATVNGMLSALNGLFKFLGWSECRARFLKVQRKLFQDTRRELSRGEYERILATAKEKGLERLALVMETICATGIRVSEVQYITVEAARNGRVQIALKGKIRVILLPRKLCRKLLDYARKKKILSGKIFLTRKGRELGRRQIWAEMKALCAAASVAGSKVFPHNLRHLFATLFYKACKDIVQVADVLGHSSIETTRIYLLTSGAEHIRQMERLGLVT